MCALEHKDFFHRKQMGVGEHAQIKGLLHKLEDQNSDPCHPYKSQAYLVAHL